MRDLKPGDLVRLKGWAGSTDTGVEVSWGRPGRQRPADERLVDAAVFDTGTPALLLQTDEVEFPAPWRGRHSVAFILIGGRLGWVWPQELEPL